MHGVHAEQHRERPKGDVDVMNKFTDLEFEGTFDLGRQFNASELNGLIGNVTQEDIDRLILCDKRDNKRTEYVKVTYCNECEWWETDEKGEIGWCWNPKMIYDDRCLLMHNNDYCSKGEPKHD